jgi:hypothetical protein
MKRFWQSSIIPSLATATILAMGAASVWFVALSINASRSWGSDIWEPDYVVLPTMFSPVLLLFVCLNEISYDVFSLDFGSVILKYEYTFLLLATISVPLAVCCYWHYRRYCHTKAILWGTFVAITGVPGAIGYWLHRRWPANEWCRHCQRQAPRDREACYFCGTAFPPPPTRDIDLRISPGAIL